MSYLFPHRRHPLANRIADALLEDPAILGLRTRCLVPMITDRFGCCTSVAMKAVAIARSHG